ncbi:MAG: TonB-dependent receptor [Bacteroidetes bacterium B1(2017)]|nr:MAG: TonB-dependent receptor [Bacteroidetes bacterium B1(2017)]
MRLKCLFFFLLTLFIFFASFQVSAQQLTISGYVKDSATGETLIGASIRNVEGTFGTVTNVYGFFSIRVPSTTTQLNCSYIGYKPKTVSIKNLKGSAIEIELAPKNILEKEVLISGERMDKNIRNTEMSRIELSGEKIKSMPVIFGEPDVLKAITLLPGIKSGGEASTGFYVRGGGPDQNLILMDEAVVYNPSHLFGFLSVFNSDAVKNIDIIKGGMPANYGGRLSSILNVNMREGNNQEFKYSGGIGLIATRLTAEGPIKKGKSSFLISGRRTYVDALAKPFLPATIKGNSYYFYDLNLKMNFILSPKDRIFISGYFGRDILDYKSERNSSVQFNFGWGNSTATARWNHVFNPKLFSNTSIIFNRYELFNDFEFGAGGFKVRSNLLDWNLKSDFTWFAQENHQVKFGVNYTFHTFQPGILTGNIGSAQIEQIITKQYAHEFAAYLLDEWKINHRLTINYGLRAVAFNLIGPYTQAEYDNDTQLPTGKSINYGKGQSIAFYPRLEPRFSGTYLLTETSSLKASYTQTYQFLHLATTSGAQFPVDLWVPSSRLVQPQMARQFALGYFRNFKDNVYETSAEVYYKPMRNQIEFKPGASLFFNQNLENEMVFGKGESYGLELFVRKKSGKLTGWIGYTLSKTTRQFDALNNGKPYFYRYDRTHDISVLLSYQFNKKWSGNFVFVYGTGNATTLPDSRYAYRFGIDPLTGEPKFVFIDKYSGVNTFRMPSYHRADISFTYLKKQTKKYESSWNFSLYNVYNRANPYFIYFLPDITTQTVKAFMVYLFPIVPSVQWNFKF